MNLPSYNQTDTSLSVNFSLEGENTGHQYSVAQFNVVFTQATDDKGEPQDFVRGGKMLIALKELVSENIHLWAMKSNILKEGEVVFSREGANAVLKVKFINASCIGFDRVIDAVGGVSTVLTLSPEQVWLNDVEFYNRWTNN